MENGASVYAVGSDSYTFTAAEPAQRPLGYPSLRCKVATSPLTQLDPNAFYRVKIFFPICSGEP